MKNVSKVLFAGACLSILACTSQPEKTLTKSGLDPQKFQTEVNGKQTQLYTLTNANGMEVCITNFGGRIVSIMVPDKAGEMQDVVLGFDSIADYINIPSDFGAAIGRYANRINQGKLVLDGETIHYHKTTTDTASTEDRQAGNIKYIPENSSTTARCN